jgi:vacuolar-type H+-ATPase subunit F/Vma7
MGRAAVIGEPLRIYGFGLAGALVCPAPTRADAVDAWQNLPPDVAVVLLTQSAAAWLADALEARPDVLTVTMPAATAGGGP